MQLPCAPPGMLFVPLLLLLLARTHTAAAAAADLFTCSSDLQVTNCGQLPISSAEEQAEYIACCQANTVTPTAAAAEVRAAAAAAAARQSLQPASVRPDLDPNGRLSTVPDFKFGKCTTPYDVFVPTFSGTQITKATQTVPRALPKPLIQNIKNAAMAWLASRPGVLKQIASKFASISYVNSASGFVHPAAISGPAELAALAFRLDTANNGGFVSPQPGGKETLLTGVGVPAKNYSTNGMVWAPPVDCPVQGYYGPLPMAQVDIKYGGVEGSASSGCNPNYPAAAPKTQCGHISFVELDGQMAIKQAMAYWATGDTRYSNTALSILEAWATTNKVFGVQKENGPLEAGWGIAAMAKALELLRQLPRGQQLLPQFASWVNSVLMPIWDYIFAQTQTAISNGAVNVYSNWHLTIADAMISFAVLTDDRPRYNTAMSLLRNATSNYLRWGRTPADTIVNGIERIPGECTETLRDIYHTQFGLGSALQAAEVAFQQGDDLYNIQGHALAAAMELHARIILAYKRNEDPPAGFKWYNDGKALPTPPAGTEWRLDLARQVWYLYDKTTFKLVPDGDLKDGFKYLIGVKFLPTGWELGLNHYLGRLGIKMPQTQALLQEFGGEWWEMAWGLGTLAAADTAYQLWRPGMTALNNMKCSTRRTTG